MTKIMKVEDVDFMKQLLVKIILCSVFSSLSYAVAQGNTLSGRDIALKADKVDTSYDSQTSATMAIWRGGRKLVRQIQTYNKKFGKDDRKLIRFLKPSDVNGVKYLIWGYDDYQKIDDMWMFLPSENLLRRISHGGMKAAFMRSDFANEDIEEDNADDFDNTLVRSEQYNGADCYVLEQIPRKKDTTQYSKKISWINKTTWLYEKTEFFNESGKHFKTAFFDKQEVIDGIWTSTRITMETPARDSKTIISYDSVQYDIGLSPTLFDPAVLKR